MNLGGIFRNALLAVQLTPQIQVVALAYLLGFLNGKKVKVAQPELTPPKTSLNPFHYIWR